MSVMMGGSLFLNSAGYQISRSVRLRSSASAYFNRNNASVPTNDKIFTYSGWVKRGALSSSMQLLSSGPAVSDQLFFQVTTDVLKVYMGADVLVTSQVFRDPSAWYHIILAVDTTQATASNRVKLYVNGAQVTAFSSTSYPTLNYVPKFNGSSYTSTIGRYQNSSSEFFDGYMTEINFIDGQALTPSSFGQTNGTTGVWSPIKYTGTYGTNGFYLNFSDNSAATAAAIGADYSGNGNNWTPNNISLTAGVTYDSMLDVPTLWADGGNGRGNYAVMNPLDVISGSNAPTYSNGNLTLAVGNANYKSRGTIGASSGKYYFEFGGTNVGGIYNTIVVTGIINESGTDWRYVVYDGTKTSGGVSGGAYGTGYGSGAWPTIGCAIDLDSGKIWFRNDSGWYASGDPAAGTNAAYTNVSGTVRPYFEGGGGGYSGTIQFNFGQRPFSYTPPTGFKALNTLNLPQPTILKGEQYMNVVTYTATPGTGNTISGVGFQTDLLWTKNRDNVEQHYWQDSVRGFSPSVGVTQMLSSNSAAAETSVAGITCTTTSDGFTVVDSAPGSGEFWFTNRTYVAWCWRANGTPAVTNTAGSITSTVSAGATQGFSIVTWAGSGAAGTIGHGLNAVPAMLITKKRTSATDSNWVVWQKNLTGGNTVTDAYYMYLNGTNGQNASGGVFYKGTDITSTTFGFQGGNANVNASGQNYVAYCFAEVAGFSAFGSYTGNGSADGPFVFLGFRPQFFLVKRTDSTSNWMLEDTSRDPSNVASLRLVPDASFAEAGTSANYLDFVSNGIKIRNLDAPWNASGGTYIYMAFAENPFKNALAR